MRSRTLIDEPHVTTAARELYRVLGSVDRPQTRGHAEGTTCSERPWSCWGRALHSCWARGAPRLPTSPSQPRRRTSASRPRDRLPSRRRTSRSRTRTTCRASRACTTPPRPTRTTVADQRYSWNPQGPQDEVTVPPAWPTPAQGKWTANTSTYHEGDPIGVVWFESNGGNTGAYFYWTTTTVTVEDKAAWDEDRGAVAGRADDARRGRPGSRRHPRRDVRRGLAADVRHRHPDLRGPRRPAARHRPRHARVGAEAQQRLRVCRGGSGPGRHRRCRLGMGSSRPAGRDASLRRRRGPGHRPGLLVRRSGGAACSSKAAT